jgi:lipopolysaccharide export system protein LptC
MNKKTVIQVLMVILIILISLFIYFKYFKKNSKNFSENTQIKEINSNKNISANYINNISYSSLDAKGNEYLITARQAEIDIDSPDVMFLENVIAYIFIKNSDTMTITSNFGKYNSKNYDTIFSKDVIVIYPNHKITGEYLDFSFLQNLGTISTNVIYTGNKTNLAADRVEMNIVTKDTKIFMNDNTKKVLIEGTK